MANFKYNENHSAIMRTISALMERRVVYYNKEGKEYSEEEFDALSASDYDHEIDESATLKKRIVDPPFPTMKEIAEASGFKIATVRKHVNEINLENFRGTFQALTPQVVAALARRASSEGKAPEVKLFLQVVENWEEKSTVANEHSGDLTVSIQRNIVSRTPGG